MALPELSKTTFDQFLGSNKVCLVDFWAEWCGPCKMMEPVLGTASEELLGKVAFAAVNVDDKPELAQSKSIMSIPTMIVYVDGKEVDRLVGAMSRSMLVKKLSAHTE
jgi:thioredoxin 1